MPGAYCPLYEDFRADFAECLKAIVSTGVKTIMLEDDYTFSGGKFMHDVGCACERHMQIFCERVGEKLTRSEAREKILSGGRNKYRTAWGEIQRETLIGFTEHIERTVHTIAPEVRVGLSGNGSSYDMEGVSVVELAKIVAGENRPFLRMTGAPYWKQTLTLAPPVEAIRLQSRWADKYDIERVTEGDTYPRPRYWVPSALLEAYDMILRADGESETILKYMVDYNSSATYETGYIDRHIKNECHYEEIARRFAGKKAVGLNVFEDQMLFSDVVFDDDYSINNYGSKTGMYSYMPKGSQWFLSDNSIPTTYGSDTGALLAFGENAARLTPEQMKRGVILDGKGAKRLFDMGVDVGFSEIKRAPMPFAEYFRTEADYGLASLEEGAVFYEMTLKEGAEISSEFIVSNSGLGVIQAQGIEDCKRYPACYRYENKDGMRFVVYSFIPETAVTINEWRPGIFRSYMRQRQLADCIKWLDGVGLPAMCYKNPDLYILAKKDESSMAVGLWNLFADSVIDPVIELDGEYMRADFYNCSGRVEGNRVILNEDITPYSFAFFTVYR